jgi:hypothetical protein
MERFPTEKYGGARTANLATREADVGGQQFESSPAKC